MGFLTVIFYLVIAVCLLIYIFLNYRFSYWKLRGVIHDKPSLFSGSLSGIGRTQHVREPFRECYRKYKGIAPFAGFYFYYRPAAIVLDLELVKCVLIKDFNYFSDRGYYYNEKDDPLSGHLFNLDGPRWKEIRSKVTPTFSTGKMKVIFPSVIRVTESLIAILEDMVTSNSGSIVVEIRELLARFTTDVIGTCAFGLDCNSLTDPKAEFRLMGKKAFTERRYSKAIYMLLQAFPAVGKRLRMKLYSGAVSDFFMRVVKETVEYREANNIKPDDFLSFLIDKKNKSDTDGSHNKNLTNEEIAAQAFIFFLAGFETSSSTMGFLLYELAVNQDIQDKARAEIRMVLEKRNGDLQFESLREMKYLNQVFCETLRVYSVGTALIRKTIKNYSVPNTKHVIEKGTLVVIPVDAIHHDPDIYPNPERFDPERFSPKEIEKRSSMSWLAFGDGPRNCVGQRFGEMQTRLGIAMLLNNFKFFLSKKTKVPLELGTNNTTLCCKSGIFLKIQRI